MKKIRLYSVRGYLKLGLFFYFRRIYVRHLSAIPEDKPVLFLANHQNALLDALLIGINNKRFSYFLTRAGVFKSAFISKILKRLQMLPVYRIRDGWNNLSNNVAIFNTCAELFNSNEQIVIFPEGSHNLKRTVRPLSKGFTRIIFETLEKYPNTDLQLVPVGLNYVNAEKFPDSALLFFGEPIAAKDLITDNKNESVINIKTRIHFEISKLTTHIPSQEYDITLDKLKNLNVNFLKPENVNKTISSNFKFYEKPKDSYFSVFRSFFKVLLILTLIVPYVIWKFVAEPRIKEIEFKSTFRFAIAITLVPIWVLFLAIFFFFNFGWIIGLGYIIMVLCLTLITVKA